jgi:hypothetical protein
MKTSSTTKNDTSDNREHTLQKLVGTSDLYETVGMCLISRTATIKHIGKKLSTWQLTRNAQQRDQYFSP